MVVVDKHSNQNDIVKEKVLLDDKCILETTYVA